MNRFLLRSSASIRTIVSGGPVWLFMALFWLSNSHTLALFNRINNYRVFLAAVAGATLLAILIWRYGRTISNPNETGSENLSIAAFVLLPTFATIPGWLISGGQVNYYAPLELATNLTAAGWCWATYHCIRTERDWDRVGAMLAVTLIWVGIWSALEWYGLSSFRWNTLNGRIAAFYGNSNYLAGFLVLVLPLALTWAWGRPAGASGRTLVGCVFAWAAFFAGVLCLFGTGSRAGMVAGAFGLVITALLRVRVGAASATRIRRLFTLALVGVSLFAAGMMFWNLGRFENVFSIFGWAPRITSWNAAINAVSQAPLFGYGPGASYSLFFAYAPADRGLYHDIGSFKHVHNEFLEVAEEGGALAVIAVLTVWLWLLSRLWKIRRDADRNPTATQWTAGLFGALTGYLVHSQFSVAPRMMAVELPLAVAMGLVLALARDSRATASNILPDMFSYKVSPNRWLLFAIWTGLLAWVLAPWLMASHDLYNFRRYTTNKNALILERNIKTIDNIYLLDRLARYQFKRKKYRELLVTTKQAQRILPGYRRMPEFAALARYRLGDRAGALELALKNQQRNAYQQGTIRLLIKVAAETQQLQLFLNQIERIFRVSVTRSGLYGDISANNIQISLRRQSSRLEFVERRNRVDFAVSYPFATELLKAFASRSKAVRGSALARLNDSLLSAGFVELANNRDNESRRKTALLTFSRLLKKATR